MSLCTPTLRSELRDVLLQLNFHAYLQVLCQVLRHMGYEEVRLAGRTGYVGRNSGGGADILAYRTVPGGRRAVVVQAKQFPADRQIYQRSLDELRGVILRTGAAEGIFVTTSSFSESIPAEQLSSAPIVPLRFIDGEILANQMTLYRVGIKKLPALYEPGKSPYILDRRYFDSVNAEFSGVARAGGNEPRAVYIIVGGKARKQSGGL